MNKLLLRSLIIVGALSWMQLPEASAQVVRKRSSDIRMVIGADGELQYDSTQVDSLNQQYLQRVDKQRQLEGVSHRADDIGKFDRRKEQPTVQKDSIPTDGPDPLANDGPELSEPGEYFAPIEYPHVQSAISFDDINLYGMSELQKSFLQTFYDEYTSLLKQRSDLLVLRLELERRLAHKQDLLALKKEASGKQEEIMAALDPDSDDMTELDATKKSEIKREIKEIERVIETINVIVGEEQPEDGSDKEAYLEAAERTGLFARIGNFFEQLFGDTNRFGPGGYSLEREEALADRFEQHASTLKKPTTQERVQQAGKEIGIEIGGK